MWMLGTAEMRGGNWSEGIKIYERFLAEDISPVVLAQLHGVIARRYAIMGDLTAADDSLLLKVITQQIYGGLWLCF
jgi:hypothetical protein